MLIVLVVVVVVDVVVHCYSIDYVIVDCERREEEKEERREERKEEEPLIHTALRDGLAADASAILRGTIVYSATSGGGGCGT
jgi:hypothetical protein